MNEKATRKAERDKCEKERPSRGKKGSYQEGYQKALDEFVDKVNSFDTLGGNWFMFHKRTMEYIRELEKLKKGENAKIRKRGEVYESMDC